MATVFAVRFGRHQVDLRDLEAARIQRIADTHKVDWLLVLTAPVADLGVAADVIRAGADHLGVDDPPLASTRDVITAVEECLVPVTDEETSLKERVGSRD